MEFQKLIGSLERFQTVLPSLVHGLDEQAVRWKPESKNWSILEIVCHLADEEVEDFRARVQMTLQDPKQDWPTIDPVGVADERRYNDANFEEVLQRWVLERQNSVAWLRELKEPDWQQAYQHPKYGPICAGEVLAAWAAHDHLHTRQIAKRLFEMTARDGKPFSIKYAGDWG